LKRRGIDTAQDFVSKDLSWVKHNLSKPYEVIWRELFGVSMMHIDPIQKTVYSSIQKTRSFHPATNDKTFLFSQISKHIEDACTKARHFHLAPKKISIFLKDKDFKFTNVSIPVSSPTNAPEILISLVKKQFEKMHTPRTLYRTTGVVLQDLVSGLVSQSDLFGGTDDAHKFERIHEQIDSLENKFGRRVVYLASTHNALKQKKSGTDSDDLDRNLLFL
jgi:impB/mucB/samB family C-terminal domain